jgi:hypothetical protein
LRDLSLHILDLIENSLRAGAQRVDVTIAQRVDLDEMVIAVEDDGPGLPVTPAQATDPFFTTKSGKRVGLGLSLFQAAAERAGGGMELDRSPLGGLAVRATLRLGHLDRNPLGDVPATMASALCAEPEVRFRLLFEVDGRRAEVDSYETVERLIDRSVDLGALPMEFAAEVARAMERVGVMP